ncbi:MAG: cytochrome c oxidase assembly protein [Rhodospirillales bacterium]|nr:cytochrome c oxidase assembly protein [Rhodospirillales bacterium]
MLGLSFASATLYRMFCQATGYDGTPKTTDVAKPTRRGDETVVVRFDANVNPALPWRFEPAQRQVTVHTGEETLVHFNATNLSDHPITGTATFSVVPEKAAAYFDKLQCFCFSEQTLEPKQEVSMPVVFYVDPGLYEDPTTRDVKTITLSYTFFRAEGEAEQQKPAPRLAAAPSAGTGG